MLWGPEHEQLKQRLNILQSRNPVSPSVKLLLLKFISIHLRRMMLHSNVSSTASLPKLYSTQHVGHEEPCATRL